MHHEAAAQELGRRIREARKQQGLRQDELALAAGVSTRAVHQVERGKPTTRLDVVTRLLAALGLRLEVTPAPRALAESPQRRRGGPASRV